MGAGPNDAGSSAPKGTRPVKRLCSTPSRVRSRSGLSWLTVYTFSTENWRRPLDEVRYLMAFNERLLVHPARRPNDERGAACRFISQHSGRRPRAACGTASRRPKRSPTNRRLTPWSPFDSGGRAELVDAIRGIASEVTKQSSPGQGQQARRAPPSVHARHARSRPARPHVGLRIPGSRTTCSGSTAHSELTCSPMSYGRTSVGRTCSRPSPSTNSGSVASAGV